MLEYVVGTKMRVLMLNCKSVSECPSSHYRNIVSVNLIFPFQNDQSDYSLSVNTGDIELPDMDFLW